MKLAVQKNHLVTFSRVVAKVSKTPKNGVFENFRFKFNFLIKKCDFYRRF